MHVAGPLAVVSPPNPRSSTPEVIVVWRAHTEAVKELLRSKNAYGTAWRDQGYMGNIGRVLSKASRLRNLMWRDVPQGADFDMDQDGYPETLLDTLKDLSALCAFAIANLEEGNRWGNQ